MITLSTIMPAYNEAANIEEAIRITGSALQGAGISWELVVVNDGSGDGTGEILAALAATAPEAIRVVTHPRNQGFGAALRTGICAARGVFCIVVPADNPLTPATLQPFLEVAPQADIVLGWRPERPGYSPLMRFNTRFYHLLLRLFFGVKCRDANWQHLYRRSIFERINIETGGVVMGAEMIIKAQRLGLRIAEVACPMRPRVGGVASAARPKVMARTGSEFSRFFWRWYFCGARNTLSKGLIDSPTPSAGAERTAA